MPTDRPPFPVDGPAREQSVLIRSEERLAVTTRRVVAGIARLEKIRVTETRTFTVDVVREEVRLVIDRDTAGSDVDDRGAARPAGPEGPWLVLSEEQVVVTKNLVPVERVRLDVTPVTEMRDVTAAVRSERVEVTHVPAPGSDTIG
ncbi:YsnF/AvaK domain-containing protein [Nakamurella flavida]|uniref:YsnF/AvaK domain-containing protein n=1 Tax=Nakamurella flavida TaxID=363630 RepID=A0A939C3G7_9ACTN|nr:YsnF/AvaK domain-containing protein [Nakamurella flavida]MBM9477630.1 YsnF/AvaK domain-containing protein [Nakamurella flavida]MDP9779180.1 uncharacterized protein (TIGR02271 family) [Nakamurella flavida]